ncbi:MAG: hypothetical protein KGD65_08620 [Candidatus Lokiarchaeota archaeon]|nr:hypothetical protein [Candidatus Lokiarchaeota archaeon]
MFFQISNDAIGPILSAVFLILIGMIIFKFGLAVTKAESKTNFKWVAGSFLLQYGVTLFISAPMLLDMVLVFIAGTPYDYRGPDPGLMAMSIIFSTFIIINLINMIHRPGIKRSFIIALLILGPIFFSNYIIFSNLGNII